MTAIIINRRDRFPFCLSLLSSQVPPMPNSFVQGGSRRSPAVFSARRGALEAEIERALARGTLSHHKAFEALQLLLRQLAMEVADLARLVDEGFERRACELALQ